LHISIERIVFLASFSAQLWASTVAIPSVQGFENPKLFGHPLEPGFEHLQQAIPPEKPSDVL